MKTLMSNYYNKGDIIECFGQLILVLSHKCYCPHGSFDDHWESKRSEYHYHYFVNNHFKVFFEGSQIDIQSVKI